MLANFAFLRGGGILANFSYFFVGGMLANFAFLEGGNAGQFCIFVVSPLKAP